MRKVLSSEVIRKEFAMATSHLSGAQVEVPKQSKPSVVKRAVMYAVLAVGIGSGAAVAIGASMPTYEEPVGAVICWDCSSKDAYKTPKEAIKAINPHANDKLIALAEEEFRAMNKLPHDDYSTFLKAGEYKIPVVKVGK